MKYIFGIVLTVCALTSFAFGQDAQAPAAAPASPVPAAPVSAPAPAPVAQEAAVQEIPVSQDAAAQEAPIEEFRLLEEPVELRVQHGFQVEQEAQPAQPAEEPLTPEEQPVETAAERPVDQPVVEETGRQSRTKLGVMWLTSATGHDKAALEMTRAMIARLDTLGLYEMYYPEDIEKALRDSRVRVSNDCRDQRCVNDIGKALGLRRMIYGSIDMTGSQYGVQLVLLNVVSGRIIESANLEGAPGVPARDVLLAAINRLHGAKDETPNMSHYYGPPVNNLSEFLWTTVAVQGTGIFYSLINYGVGGAPKPLDGIDYVPYSKESLSGIPGASNQIPMFARPAALANAYTAVSDDAYGVLYNPAGMPWVKQRDVAVNYQYRFGMDLLAASYANRAMRDLGFGQAIMLATDRDGAMTEMFFVTAVGYRINQDYLFGPLSLGASVKLMGNTVRALSPDSPYGQSYGIGLDLGFMWELADNIKYGLLFRDVPAVNMWKNRTTGSRYGEMHPPTLHMGGSYRASYSAFLTADGQIPLYADQPWLMAGGIEYEFFRVLALRVGMQREILNEEADWWKITCGAGFKFDTRAQWGKNMALDVAYEHNTQNVFNVLNVSVKVGF